MNENGKPLVEIRGVDKTYEMGVEKVHALQDVSLDIAQAQYMSIMGPSGSGKSTLFNMIGGLDVPTKGKVAVEGYTLSDLNSRQLAWFRCHKIGFIFQSFNLLYTMTALENVAIARIFAGYTPEQAEKDAAAVLDRVGLGHRLKHLPGEVSGGQQQRIAIARAFVNEPAIILADEPTGNLDLKTGQEILNMLNEMKENLGVTVITATHDMKMIAMSDKVAWLRDGKIERIADKEELNVRVSNIDGQTVA